MKHGLPEQFRLIGSGTQIVELAYPHDGIAINILPDSIKVDGEIKTLAEFKVNPHWLDKLKLNQEQLKVYTKLSSDPCESISSFKLSSSGDMKVNLEISAGDYGIDTIRTAYSTGVSALPVLSKGSVGNVKPLQRETIKLLHDLNTTRGQADVFVKQLSRRLRQRIYDLGLDKMPAEEYLLASALLSIWPAAVVKCDDNAHWTFSEGDVQVVFTSGVFVIFKGQEKLFPSRYHDMVIPFVMGLLTAQGSFVTFDIGGFHEDEWLVEADEEYKPVDIGFDPSDYVGLAEEEIIKITKGALGSKSTDSEDASAPTSLF